MELKAGSCSEIPFCFLFRKGERAVAGSDSLPKALKVQSRPQQLSLCIPACPSALPASRQKKAEVGSGNHMIYSCLCLSVFLEFFVGALEFSSEVLNAWASTAMKSLAGLAGVDPDRKSDGLHGEPNAAREGAF